MSNQNKKKTDGKWTKYTNTFHRKTQMVLWTYKDDNSFQEENVY